MDTIGDFLTRIRNAGMAKHDKVDIPSSRLREGIAKILTNAGYLRHYKVVKNGDLGLMRIYLRYTEDGAHIINNLERVSKPGRRVYVGVDDIPNVRSGYGMAILSTNKGVVSSEQATQERTGGEVLCQVW